MSLRLFATAVFVLACQVATAAPPTILFDATLKDVQGGGRILHIIFYKKLPPPPVVDKILWESLEHATLIDPTMDILAMASLGPNEGLTSNQHSGSLVYRASQKKIMTYEEYIGTKTTISSTSSYFIEVQEGKTAAGIKPERKWLSVTIVFPKQPSRDVAYDAILAETQKLTLRGLDISVYVSVGDQKVKTSWKQMVDTDGAYVFADYDAARKKLMRRGQVLKQLP